MTIKSATDYIVGFNDCKKGKPARIDASEDYNRGYGFCYEYEQVLTERSEAQNGRFVRATKSAV